MNILSDYIGMYMYVIIYFVSQILAFMKSSFPSPSGNDITTPKDFWRYDPSQN